MHRANGSEFDLRDEFEDPSVCPPSSPFYINTQMPKRLQEFARKKHFMPLYRRFEAKEHKFWEKSTRLDPSLNLGSLRDGTHSSNLAIRSIANLAKFNRKVKEDVERARTALRIAVLEKKNIRVYKMLRDANMLHILMDDVEFEDENDEFEKFLSQFAEEE